MSSALCNTSHELCTRFALCCVLMWLRTDCLHTYPSGSLYWHCSNRMTTPVQVRQPWRLSVSTQYKFTTNHATATKPNKMASCVYIPWDILYKQRLATQFIGSTPVGGRVISQETISLYAMHASSVMWTIQRNWSGGRSTLLGTRLPTWFNINPRMDD